MNRFAARKEAAAAQARTQAAKALKEETIAVVEMHHATDRIEEVRRVEIATSENQQAVLDAATPLGLDPATHLTVKLLEAQSSIEVEKVKQLHEHELNLRIQEMREQVRLAIITTVLTEHQTLQVIADLQARIYEQIQGIEQNPSLTDRTKQRMIHDYEELALTFKEDRRAREDRLLQAHDRKGLQGGEPNTDDGADG